jgi:integrase
MAKADKKNKQRVIWRQEKGRTPRAYANFRDFKAWGGNRREPLIAPGEKQATTDPKMAERLAAQRLEELQRKKDTAQGRKLSGLPDVTPLEAFAAEHLLAKSNAGRVTKGWLDGEELRLERAVAFFGKDTDLSAIRVSDVKRWNLHLKEQKLGPGTRRQHLNSLSNLYLTAQDEEKVTEGYNPVQSMKDKPTGHSEEAHWLEVPEAALLLEAARMFKPKRPDIGMAFAYPLIATALLTGGRPGEVLGLAVDDVSLEREIVTFRPHEWRRLKTLTSRRTVPLFPQLAEILREYVIAHPPTGRLLFPSVRNGEEHVLTDCRKMLDAVGKLVGFQRRELNMYDFRHTYCAARLQTLDGEAPVSPYTVGKELGHGGASLVNRVYGKLGKFRARGESVEYRVEDFKDVKVHDKPVIEWVKALRRIRAA